MQRAGLHGLLGNRRPRAKHVTPSVADLVERNFTRRARDPLWVTDITEHLTWEGKVYCAVVLDTFSRPEVGWSIDASPTAALTTNALAMAIGNRSLRPGGTIIDSDHGVPQARCRRSETPVEDAEIQSAGESRLLGGCSEVSDGQGLKCSFLLHGGVAAWRAVSEHRAQDNLVGWSRQARQFGDGLAVLRSKVPDMWGASSSPCLRGRRVPPVTHW